MKLIADCKLQISDWLRALVGRLTNKNISVGQATNRGKTLLGFGLLLMFSLHSYSQSIKATAKIDSLNYLIGDNISLHVSIQHPTGVKINWYQPQLLSDNFQKTNESKIDTVKKGALLEEDRTLTLATFDTGILKIPSLRFNYTKINRRIDSVVTNNLVIKVLTIDVDTTAAFKDIKPILQVKTVSTKRAYWLYLMPGSLLICGILILLFVRRRKPLNKNDKALIKSLQKLTLDKLSKLENEKAWADDNIEEYYIRLTLILRGYIEARYKVSAFENTSDEIIDLLQGKITNTAIIERLANDLQFADFVKFAKAIPTGQDNRGALDSAIEFVNNTSPKNGGNGF